VLNNEWLEQFDLVKNLQDEVSRINSAKNTCIQFSHSQNIKLISKRQIILFRIIQEGLQNALKHSKADNISIMLKEHDDRLFVKILDDGCGFKEQQHLNGVGLLNMKQRTESLEGTISWSSKSGAGCIVEIDVPTTTQPL
jgi:signal transduction histidine kinase